MTNLEIAKLNLKIRLIKRQYQAHTITYFTATNQLINLGLSNQKALDLLKEWTGESK